MERWENDEERTEREREGRGCDIYTSIVIGS